MANVNRLFDKFTLFCDQCENEDLKIKTQTSHSDHTKQKLQIICPNCGITETLVPIASGKKEEKHAGDHKGRGDSKAV